MKKLLVALIACFTALTTFAAPNWNAEKVEDLPYPGKDGKSDTTEMYIYHVIAKNLLGKSPADTSWEEVKNIYMKSLAEVKELKAKDNTKNINVEIIEKFEKTYQQLPVMMAWIGRFNPYATEVLKDPSFKEQDYVCIWYPLIGYGSYKKYYTTSSHKEALINVFKRQSINNITVAGYAWETYKRHYLKTCKAEEALADLKFFKRSLYFNIQKSDEWKKILVEIELAIKSLE